MFITIITPSVNKDRLKRKTKHSFSSLYRDYPHTTINGKGLVARIYSKKGKKK